jgi:hypothetical protein
VLATVVQTGSLCSSTNLNPELNQHYSSRTRTEQNQNQWFGSSVLVQNRVFELNFGITMRTDQASGDLMEVVASCFYRRVHDFILEGLIEIVWKSKKPMDNRNARAFDGHQEEEKKHIHSETLKRVL